eukprot:m.120202 g.120202  ORF g.120202 m.120202 type:complete len:537 (-) comp9370_c1_seq1:74-1684(-)
MDVYSWDAEKVSEFLSQLKLSRMIEDCRYNQVTGKDLLNKSFKELSKVLCPLKPMTQTERSTLEAGLSSLIDQPQYTIMVDRRETNPEGPEEEYTDMNDANLPSKVKPAPLKKRVMSYDDSKPKRPTTMLDTSVEDLLPTCAFKGWMHKRGDVRKTWKLRYFVLHEGSLYYFNSSQGDMKGGFSLNGLRLGRSVKSTRDNVFQLSHTSGKGRVWILATNTPEEQRKWMKAIRLEVYRYDDTEEDGIEPIEDLDEVEDGGSGDESDGGDDDYEFPFDDSLPSHMDSSAGNVKKAPKPLPRAVNPPVVEYNSTSYISDVIPSSDHIEKNPVSASRNHVPPTSDDEEDSQYLRAEEMAEYEKKISHKSPADSVPVPAVPSRMNRAKILSSRGHAELNIQPTALNRFSTVPEDTGDYEESKDADYESPSEQKKEVEHVPVQEMPCFYEGMTRVVAEKFLKIPGEFLLRRSKKDSPPVLSLFGMEKCKHFKIYHQKGKGHTLGFEGHEDYFQSVPALIEYYKESLIPTTSMMLASPCKCTK